MLPVSSINNLFISPRCGNDTWHTTTRTGIPPSRKLFWHLGLGALWPSEVKSQVQANPARGLSCQPHASSVPKGEKAAMAGCTLQDTSTSNRVCSGSWSWVWLQGSFCCYSEGSGRLSTNRAVTTFKVFLLHFFPILFKLS